MLPLEVNAIGMARAMIRHLWRVGDRTTTGDLGDKIYEGFLQNHLNYSQTNKDQILLEELQKL